MFFFILNVQIFFNSLNLKIKSAAIFCSSLEKRRPLLFLGEVHHILLITRNHFYEEWGGLMVSDQIQFCVWSENSIRMSVILKLYVRILMRTTPPINFYACLECGYMGLISWTGSNLDLTIRILNGYNRMNYKDYKNLTIPILNRYKIQIKFDRMLLREWIISNTKPLLLFGVIPT